MNVLKLKMAVAMAALVAGSGVSAGENNNMFETRNVAVRFERSEFTTQDGVAAVYARLGSAARTACGNPSARLAEKVRWQHCRDAALDEAVSSVNDARLSALHDGSLPRRMLAQGQSAGQTTGS